MIYVCFLRHLPANNVIIGAPTFHVYESTADSVSVYVSTDKFSYALGRSTALTHPIACEEAAKNALQSLQRSKDSGIPMKPALSVSQDPPNKDLKRKAASMSVVVEDEGDAQCNAVALFHLYLSALSGESAAPIFDIIKVGESSFTCNLKISLLGQRIESHGHGSSKLEAKRKSCQGVLG